jgi:hypothetical protein
MPNIGWCEFYVPRGNGVVLMLVQFVRIQKLDCVQMKRIIICYIVVSTLYIISTFVYSLTFGLPPFNHGVVIGFPSVYYIFKVSDDSFQYGFSNPINIAINILITGVISLIVFYAFKRFKSNSVRK